MADKRPVAGLGAGLSDRFTYARMSVFCSVGAAEDHLQSVSLDGDDLDIVAAL